MLATLLERLDIKDWTLELNSVGCPADRARFNEALRTALEPVTAQMCADCQRRAVTNPLRVFDCKVPEDQPIIDSLPRISQFLDEGCRQHFEEVQAILKSVGVPFTLNDSSFAASTTTPAPPLSSRPKARWERKTPSSAVAVMTACPKHSAVQPRPVSALPSAKIAWSCP